jgi:N-acetylmuramoyl-L-alanine amidase
MNKNTPEYLIIHHTGGTDAYPLADSSNQTFEDVNAYHRTAPNVWLGYLSSLGYAIGYHYYIDKKGKVTQGRADTDEGAHCIGYNRVSLGICLAGNFDATMPTPEQIEALKHLVVQKQLVYNIPLSKVLPHRTFAQKTCYGRLLPDNWVQMLLTAPPATAGLCTADVVKKAKWYDNLVAYIKSQQ